jgi:multidrug transporter EmrE-like cation transporter
LGLISDIVGTVVDVVSTIVGAAVSWVYKGLAWTLGLVLPEKTAKKLARIVTISAAVYFGYRFYLQAYKFLAHAGMRLAGTAYTIWRATSGHGVALAGILPVLSWYKRLVGIWALYGVYKVGDLAWHRAQ